jgi:hypothetical protein
VDRFHLGKFLSVCPPGEAVQWLRERREKISDVNHEAIALNNWSG